MKTYSKGKLKFKRLFIFLIMLFITLLLFGLILLFAFCLKDKFDISIDTNEAMNVPDDVAANSQPIVIDNLVVGALYNNAWVSASKYYLKSTKKSDNCNTIFQK